MANNHFLKWIIGLSSVVVFTGFVGLSQQQEQNKVALAQNSNHAQSTVNTSDDPNQRSDSGQGQTLDQENNETSSQEPRADRSNQNPSIHSGSESEGFSNQNQNSQRIRTRAS